MPLSFLVPAFLVGLAALAIPVLVHLTRRQSDRAVRFPSLMFLRGIATPSTRRRRVRHWPLLLLRCAALALIALAFARPLLQRDGAAPVTMEGGSREVVVLLDRSYSMGQAGRWERAVRAADSAVATLRPQDRATLVLFDAASEATTPATPDHALLRAALAEARPGPRTTRYVPALRHAQRILAASPLPRRQVVLISDFRGGGWAADAAEAPSVRLPAGSTVHPVPVGEGEQTNLSLATASFRRSLAAGRERVAVTARLTAPAGEAPPAVPVTLEVDGRPVATREVRMREGAGTVEFPAVTLPQQGALRGVLRIPADVLPADDALHFVLAPDQRPGVLVVRGGGTGEYLTRALSIGDEPGFRVTERAAGALRAADLAGQSVVVLDQAPFPGGALGERLRAWVQGGGGLVVVLGEQRAGGWRGVIPDAAAVVDRSATGGTALGYLDLNHPILEPFATPRSGDLAAARVFRYRSLPATQAQRVVARFGDGAVALAEQPVGRGRLVLWASTLDTRWNDLPLQPVFLPLVHRVVQHAAGEAADREWLTVGEPLDPRALRAGDAVLARTPSGRVVELRDGAALELEEPGHYELRREPRGPAAATLAVNVDRAESDATPLDPGAVASAFASRAPAEALAAGMLTPQERERQQNGWWYLLVVAALLLAAETVLSNRLARTAHAGGR